MSRLQPSCPRTLPTATPTLPVARTRISSSCPPVQYRCTARAATTGEGDTPGMVIVARVRRYTQQKDQLWSGHCQAVRGTEGQGSCTLVQLCPGQRRAHLATCDTPLHRRWQVESAGSMFIGRMAAGPHSAQTISVWEGGSRYGHTVMLARIPRRRGKCKAQTALRGGMLLADRQA